MSHDADEALATFCAEVSSSGSLWTTRVGGSIATVSTEGGESITPLWSTRERIELFLSLHDQFKGHSPLEVPWPTFRGAWVGKIIPAGSEVGINWTTSKESCCASAQELIDAVENAT